MSVFARLAPYRRFIAIALAASAAGIAMPFTGGLDAVMLPGMAEPYVLGRYDPIIIAAVVYLAVFSAAGRLMNWAAARAGISDDPV